MSFVNVYEFVCVLFPFWVLGVGWRWDWIVLIPDHCLSVYLEGPEESRRGLDKYSLQQKQQEESLPVVKDLTSENRVDPQLSRTCLYIMPYRRTRDSQQITRLWVRAIQL